MASQDIYLPDTPTTLPNNPPSDPEVSALATPPIQLRNTYPAAQASIGPAPKPLGGAPTSVNQIEFPGSVLGTHFAGPLISGPAPGANYASGSAFLALTLQIDWSMGNFNIPVQFPSGSFIQSVTAVTYEAGLGAAVSVSLGTQSGATDIVSFTLPAKGTVLPPVEPTVQLPLWDGVCPFCPFQAWLSVGSNTGHTAGGAIVIIQYVRVAAPWSPAAKNYNKPGA